MSNSYQLGNDWEHARARLRALEQVHDPLSIRRLEEIGVGAGWRCLELGPGGGSITEWLCERVGDTGSVVAIDLDPRFVERLTFPNLEVRAADIVTSDLEMDGFDLVFTRLTLQHIAERDVVLEKLVRALKPGGWIVVHDLDNQGAGRGGTQRVALPVSAQVASALEHVAAAAAALNARTGRDMAYGGKVYGQLAGLGLVQLECEFYNRVIRADSPAGQLMTLNSQQLRPNFVATGLVTEGELDLLDEATAQPDFARWGAGIVVTSGERPS